MNIINRLLKSDEPKSEEIRKALDVLAERAKSLHAELEPIQRANARNNIGHGAERQRLLEHGSPEDILELDKREDLIRAELQQVPAQQEALRRKLDEAEKVEAQGRLPKRIRDLPKAIAKHKRAQEALAQARSSLDEIVTGITTDRNTIGDDAPGVEPEVAEQVAVIRGCAKEPDNPARYNTEKAYLYHYLGAGRTERRQHEYNPHPKPQGEYERVTDEELARQPEQSFWAKREPGNPL